MGKIKGQYSGFWEIQKIGMRLFPALNLSKERKMTVLIDSFWPTL